MKKSLIVTTIFAAFSIASTAAQPLIFHYSFGESELILLSESQGQGNPSILIGTTPQMLEKYTSGGTFPNAVNTFLLKHKGQNHLFDTGYGTKLFDNLDSIGMRPEQIQAIYLTHMHGDHIGGLMKEDTPAFPESRILLSGAEYDYWSDDESMKAVPQNKWGSFLQARKVFDLYKDSIKKIDDITIEKALSGGDGIFPVKAYGHTPGHIGYLIASGGERLFIWGDLTHAMAVQMPYPQVATTYDVDPELAVKSRLHLLKVLSDNNIPIAGMHIAYPGIGRVSDAPEGGYLFTPAMAQ